MKTFRQAILESREGDELYDIKLRLGEWWKNNSNSSKFRKDKKNLENFFNTALDSLDKAIDIVYEKSMIAYNESYLLESNSIITSSALSEALKTANKEKEFDFFIKHIPSGAAIDEIKTVFNDISNDPKLLNEFISGLHSKTNPKQISPKDYSLRGSVAYRFFNLQPSGIGRGELFLAWILKGAIIQGGGESFDMKIGTDKYEIKDYRHSNSAAIRLGVKGKVAQFEFFNELVDTVKMLEKLKGRFEQSNFDLDNFFGKEFSNLVDIIISNKVKWFSGEINKEDLKNIKNFYSIVKSVEPKLSGYTNVIFRGADKKPVEMSIAPIDNISGGSITITPATEDNFMNYVLTELRRIKYARDPEAFEKDLQDTVDNIVSGTTFIVFRQNKINITSEFVFDRVSTGGIYIIEREQLKK